MAFLKRFGLLFRRSAGELRSVKCIAVTGVLIAVYVALKAYATVPIIPPILRLNFAYVALAAIGMLYGPSVAMLASLPCDLIGMLLLGQGGNFMWGLTLVCVFKGLVYGVLLYGFELKKSVWKNAKLIIAQALVVLVGQLVFNTIVLYLYGWLGSDETIFELILARVTKNLIELPVSVVFLYAVLVPMRIAYGRVFKRA